MSESLKIESKDLSIKDLYKDFYAVPDFQRGYAKKRPRYQQSSFLLTKSLNRRPQEGLNTQLNRAVKRLISFENWDFKAIERHKEMLTELATLAWHLPEEKTTE